MEVQYRDILTRLKAPPQVLAATRQNESFSDTGNINRLEGEFCSRGKEQENKIVCPSCNPQQRAVAKHLSFAGPTSQCKILFSFRQHSMVSRLYLHTNTVQERMLFYWLTRLGHRYLIFFRNNIPLVPGFKSIPMHFRCVQYSQRSHPTHSLLSPPTPHFRHFCASTEVSLFPHGLVAAPEELAWGTWGCRFAVLVCWHHQDSDTAPPHLCHFGMKLLLVHSGAR